MTRARHRRRGAGRRVAADRRRAATGAAVPAVRRARRAADLRARRAHATAGAYDLVPWPSRCPAGDRRRPAAVRDGAGPARRAPPAAPLAADAGAAPRRRGALAARLAPPWPGTGAGPRVGVRRRRGQRCAPLRRVTATARARRRRPPSCSPPPRCWPRSAPADRLPPASSRRRARRIVLVGGGDTLLAPGAGDPHAVAGRAGLADLAARTAAAALTARADEPVALRAGRPALPGPATPPVWDRADVAHGYTGRWPRSACAERPHAHPPAPADPRADAAQGVRERARGARGSGDRWPATCRTAPGDRAARLVQRRSAPIARRRGRALADSDNALAEVLARLAARGRRAPADVRGAARCAVERRSAASA